MAVTILRNNWKVIHNELSMLITIKDRQVYFREIINDAFPDCIVSDEQSVVEMRAWDKQSLFALDQSSTFSVLPMDSINILAGLNKTVISFCPDC